MLPTLSLVECSTASRGLVRLRRFCHPSGTFLWFFGVWLACLSSPLSWLRINTKPERHPFYLLSSRPKGLVSCTVSPFVCSIHRVWRFSTFTFLLDFVAKTQNPLVPDPHFDEITIPSLDDFVGGDRDELLHYLIRALRKYLSRTKHYRPDIEGLFIVPWLVWGWDIEMLFVRPFFVNKWRFHTRTDVTLP